MNHRITHKRFNWPLAGLGACCVLGIVAMILVSNQPRKEPEKIENEIKLEVMPQKTSTSSQVLIDSRVFLSEAPPFWLNAPRPEPCPVLEPQPVLVLPHYGPAYRSIEQTLSTWTACRREGAPIKRVIVIGPDHHRMVPTGSSTLSAEGYLSPLGTVLVDAEVRGLLVEQGAQSSKTLFTNEHGVGLFPVLIKQWFPEATFTPLVISSTAKKEELTPLSTAIKKEMEKGDVLVIITADFSHYLAKEIADARDQETRAAFEKKNLPFFWSARDDHTDFGRGIWFGWQLAGDASSFQIVELLNSVDMGGPRNNTTSFFLGWWN